MFELGDIVEYDYSRRGKVVQVKELSNTECDIQVEKSYGDVMWFNHKYLTNITKR